MTTLTASTERPTGLHSEQDDGDPYTVVESAPPEPWDEPDPPQPAAVLPAYPSGTLDLWAVGGPDLDAAPDEISEATCLKLYGDHEYGQAIRDAERKARSTRREHRVCDSRGRVWFRARAA